MPVHSRFAGVVCLSGVVAGRTLLQQLESAEISRAMQTSPHGDIMHMIQKGAVSFAQSAQAAAHTSGLKAQGSGVGEFDETWFGENCNIKGSPLDEYEYYSANPWKKGMKCQGKEGEADQEWTKLKENDEGRDECEKRCGEFAKATPGQAHCCEFDQDRGKCSVGKGWLTVQPSSYGRHASWRTPKQIKMVKVDEQGRLMGVKSQSEQEEQEKQERDMEFTRTASGQQYMRELVTQVNHMSIEGILNHLLSFYICMRWVPDEQFRKVTKFELENVSLDQETQKQGPGAVSEDELYRSYVRFDTIPIKCSTAVHVQSVPGMTRLAEQLEDKTSAIHEAYEYSRDVASANWVNLKVLELKKWFGAVDATKKKMRDEMAVADMNKKAHSLLPWDGFIRPSQRYTKFFGLAHDAAHVSAPDNLFFICFGPRVTSFPHKRPEGEHFLADNNMSGCNGLWSLEDTVMHIKRVMSLFAPETCLTEDLKRQLKTVFLETFVEMNQDFEQKITGNFVRETNLIEAVPEKIRQQSENMKEGGELASLEEDRVRTKYQHTARLMAGAHTKWIVCDASDAVKSESFGLEDNFFRNKRAYAKWLEIDDKEAKVPECRVMDEATGCVKCAITVRSHPWRCLIRLGLQVSDVMKVIKDRNPHLMSQYTTTVYEKRALENGTMVEEPVVKKAPGACLVGRNGHMDVERLTDEAKFSNIDDRDSVYVIKPKTDKTFEVSERYTVAARKRSLVDKLEAEASHSQVDTTQMELAEQIKAQMDGDSWQTRKSEQFVKFSYSELVEEENNRPAHYVEYIMSCPCTRWDFSNRKKMASFANYETMAEFYNDAV